MAVIRSRAIGSANWSLSTQAHPLCLLSTHFSERRSVQSGLLSYGAFCWRDASRRARPRFYRAALALQPPTAAREMRSLHCMATTVSRGRCGGRQGGVRGGWSGGAQEELRAREVWFRHVRTRVVGWLRGVRFGDKEGLYS